MIIILQIAGFLYLACCLYGFVRVIREGEFFDSILRESRDDLAKQDFSQGVPDSWVNVGAFLAVAAFAAETVVGSPFWVIPLVWDKLKLRWMFFRGDYAGIKEYIRKVREESAELEEEKK